MPGRLIQDPEDLSAMLAHFGVKPAAKLLKGWDARYNLAPGEDALCVRQSGRRRCSEMFG